MDNDNNTNDIHTIFKKIVRQKKHKRLFQNVNALFFYRSV